MLHNGDDSMISSFVELIVLLLCFKMGLNRRLVYDTLHKSVVTFLIGFTGVGTVWLTYKGFNWYLCM